MKKRTVYVIGILMFVLNACTEHNNKSDAYGNFESDEVTVSSETNGRIIIANINEGTKVSKGEILAEIDTANLGLQKAQLLSQEQSVLAQKAGLNAQIAVTDQQIKNLQVDQSRLQKMFKEGASTQKQLDDISGQIALAEKQKKAFAAQISAIDKNAGAVRAQSSVISDQIKRSVVKSPISGTVLEQYVEPGELATPGKPLYKITNLDTLKLRVYVSGKQLSQIKTGSPVKVLIDEENGIKELKGSVEWISSEAEFTPKIIQTREERVKLVYAVKVRVPNDGTLKLGMPGEIKF
jgi:HlyD family secretion protein